MGLTPATAAEDILSTVADSLMLIGLDGKIIHANRKVHDLLGYTEEELKGRDIVSILSGIEMSAIVESGGVYSNENYVSNEEWRTNSDASFGICSKGSRRRSGGNCSNSFGHN